MSRSRSRENRASVTFWMDKNLKKVAQSRIQSIDGLTLTDLINRAVEYYLKEAPKINDEVGKKLAMAELVDDLKETGKMELFMAEMSEGYKGLLARVNALEKQMEELATGEALHQIIRANVSARIDPIIDRLSVIIGKLDPTRLE